MASSGKTARSQPAASACSQRVEDPLDVAVEVADDGVELAQRDTQPGHDGQATGVPRGAREASDRRSTTLAACSRRELDEAVERLGRARRRRATRSSGCARRPARQRRPARRRPGSGRGGRRGDRRQPPSLTRLHRDRPGGARRPRRPRPSARRPSVDAADRAAPRWKRREYLRIAARDLLGLDALEATVAARVGAGRATCWPWPHDLAERRRHLAVDRHGQARRRELNYASDVDVMFVGDGDPTALDRCARRLIDLARRCFRVDANLRPEGRDGAARPRRSTRYEAYWDRWAAAVGVPGAAEGPHRGRRRRARRGLRRGGGRATCGRGCSAPTTCARCGASRPGPRPRWPARG